jgi:hypothetical protein
MVMQLSQDLTITFILSFGLGLAAILFSYYNFRVSRARTSKSEQIKTSRDLWERINEKYDPIIEIGRSQGWPNNGSGIIDVPWPMIRSLVMEIDYFAHLILMDEIKDETALRYYRHHLSSYIETIMRHYASPDYRHDLRDQYSDFDSLIRRWNINMPDNDS